MIISTKTRRHFLEVFGLGAASTFIPKLPTRPADTLHWHDVESWGVEGKGWGETLRYFDRLPSKAKDLVRKPVWQLSRHSAGMCVHFNTDAQEISVKYLLRSDRLAMPHMPATGVSGLDLYIQDTYGKWRWCAILQPRGQAIDQKIATNLPAGTKKFKLYLPLYNGVERLSIGVPTDSTFEAIAPRSQKSILFYGTSILHGACASRPGMAFPAILGRRFNEPTINLGFSGNGRMEAEVASLISEIEAKAFCIDCLPNMNGEQVLERAPILVKTLREKHPSTPILLVEDRMNDNAAYREGRVAHHLANRSALQEVYLKSKSEGIPELYYLTGDMHLGTDGDGTTDGSHPNDLGMVRYADNYEPALNRILSKY